MLGDLIKIFLECTVNWVLPVTYRINDRKWATNKDEELITDRKLVQTSWQQQGKAKSLTHKCARGKQEGRRQKCWDHGANAKTARWGGSVRPHL